MNVCSLVWFLCVFDGSVSVWVQGAIIVLRVTCLKFNNLLLQQSESSSSSSVSTMLVTQDYVAVKEDEISVVQGEVVQMLASNQQNMFLVYRAANELCPAAEGWIPGFVLGHTSSSITPELPEGTIK